MASMQKALTGPRAGASLNGTLTQPQVANAGAAAPPPPAADPAVNPDDAASSAAVEGYKQKIMDIMKSHQDVDYDKLYSDMNSKMSALQPQTKAVNPLVAAAAAFGSRSAGQDMLGLAEQRQGEEKQINTNRMELQLKILDRKAEQALSKGKADEALQTNAEATKLEEELGRIRSNRAAKQQQALAGTQETGRENLERVKQQGRSAIQQMKDSVNREKIRSANEKLGALKLSQPDLMAMNAEKQAAYNELDRATGFNPETMEVPTAEAIRAAHERFDSAISDIQSRYGAKVQKGQTETPPAPAAAPGASGGAKWADALAQAKKARLATEGAQKKE